MDAPRDQVEAWIQQTVPGRSFVDIGGIGVHSGNERTTAATRAGAKSVAIADIQGPDSEEWGIYRKIKAANGLTDVTEHTGVDIRKNETLKPLGQYDVVHCTGIFYHLPSPPDALWNLRTVVGKHLITNTVTYPGRVSNEHGTLELPESGVLFLGALSARDRRILNHYYQEKFGWTIDMLSPDPKLRLDHNAWIENGELTCWPCWFLFTDHGFRSLIELCRFKVLEQYKWADHTLQVLCERED